MSSEPSNTSGTLGPNVKLNRLRIAALKEAIEFGLPKIDACRLTHTSPASFARWMQEGKRIERELDEFPEKPLTEYEGLLLELVQEIGMGEANYIRRNAVLVLSAASGGVWQAAAWALERKRSADFGRVQKVEIGTVEAEDIPPLQDTIKEALSRTLGGNKSHADHGAGTKPPTSPENTGNSGPPGHSPASG